MAPPLYFLPHTSAGDVAPGGRLNRQLLRDRGLDGVFADVQSPQLDCSLNALAGRGPENLPGVILCAFSSSSGGEPPRRLGYYPREQTWHACYERMKDEGGRMNEEKLQPSSFSLHPSFYLGLDTASPPTPADLARKQIYRGHRVKLADGHEWEVPILRSPAGVTSLPRSMSWDAAGSFELRVKRDYVAAWDASEATMRLFYEPGSDRTIDLEEACLRGLEALAINYRVGRAEQSILGLIDSTNWEEVLLASVDGPTVTAYLTAQKKNTPSPPIPGSPSSTPGERASPPPIAPAAESCSLQG